jgi:hypothetical protein
MARFIMITPIVGAPPGNQYRKWPRGQTIADSAGNALAGDIVWPALTAAPSALNLAPLDASALALMPGSAITTLAALAAGATLVGGATLDAGD